jgi:hypothetical protein
VGDALVSAMPQTTPTTYSVVVHSDATDWYEVEAASVEEAKEKVLRDPDIFNNPVSSTKYGSSSRVEAFKRPMA